MQGNWGGIILIMQVMFTWENKCSSQQCHISVSSNWSYVIKNDSNIFTWNQSAKSSVLKSSQKWK